MLHVRPTVCPQANVNELLRRFPFVRPVLDAFGVDSARTDGGSLASAASAAHIPLDALMAAVAASIRRVETHDVLTHHSDER